MKSCYVNLIGKNGTPFDNILQKIGELTDDETLDQNERVDRLVKCYKDELCIPERKDTEIDTNTERLEKAKKFFKDETLCLKYSRARYDSILRNALINVYIKQDNNTNNFELDTILDTSNDPFEANYSNALETIFSCLWSRACAQSAAGCSIYDKCRIAITLADDIIKNMSICVVLTENEHDANKLFEVLNDRALAVEDLELIKNHFYKEYCTKSNDSDQTKDHNITCLDELWTDKVFAGSGSNRNKLVSYFAAVYLTGEKELSFKDDVKYKDAIEKHYSQLLYNIATSPYTYEHILADFNVYYAVRIILDEFGVRYQKLNEWSLAAEQSNNSITYKTIHLLNAMKYQGVLAALINMIVATYANEHATAMIDDNFQNKFSVFINDLIKDSNHSDPRFLNIHKCAHILWVAAIKGKDHKLPRSIAKRIIGKYNFSSYSTEPVDLNGSEIEDLNKDFEEWTSTWTYASKKSFDIKVLLLNLLTCSRQPEAYSDNPKTVTLSPKALTYKLDAGKLNLDHLEPQKIDIAYKNKFFMYNDIESRNKYIESYIGNFMILDLPDNIKKSNVPIADSLQYYSKVKESWLIKDINAMMRNVKYFEPTKVPKPDFFIVRSKELKQYFIAYLDSPLNANNITVNIY